MFRKKKKKTKSSFLPPSISGFIYLWRMLVWLSVGWKFLTETVQCFVVINQILNIIKSSPKWKDFA